MKDIIPLFYLERRRLNPRPDSKALFATCNNFELQLVGSRMVTIAVNIEDCCDGLSEQPSGITVQLLFHNFC